MLMEIKEIFFIIIIRDLKFYRKIMTFQILMLLLQNEISGLNPLAFNLDSRFRSGFLP